MKKILISTILSVFVVFSASADTNIGISISSANMDATGSHTTNSNAGASGGDAVNASGNADFEMASFFIEQEVAAGGLNIALGLDAVPMTAEVDKLGGGDGFDATVEIGNLMTAYIQPMFDAGNVTLFLKAGLSSADVDITNVSRQATNAGTASTDGAQSKSLDGTMYGAGAQISTGSGFVRLEGTITDFDEISHTNSNSKVVKADSELTRITISFGKSF
tara:strand:- start:234 stop:893 length:660 start_codon:yes stop_codon:yes gene_type:complete